MNYQEFDPSPPLRPFVERFWVLDTVGAGELGVSPILPDGHVELIVHVGERFGELGRDGVVRDQSRLLLAAQMTEAVRVVPRRGGLMVAARLRPHAAAVLTRVPQHELTGTIHDLGGVDAGLARRITSHLSGRSDAADLASALDTVLRDELAGRSLDAGVERAVEMAVARRGLVRVDDLASATGLSTRQLERRFAHHVGLAPKRFLRILRFQQVLGLLRTSEAGDWPDLAARLGYYDQPHFINDFRSFTGETPSAWSIDESSLTGLFAGR